ncbi:MAG TPA: ornithine cyclodeaminase family protein [Usitatibacter sp.]|nr:ornithine cyclodeaminase family protein [Usitatibacter sp.]
MSAIRHFTDKAVDRALIGAPLEDVLRRAFVALADGRAAQQPRQRTEAGGVKLSTLGGVIPELGVAGAKIYTTIAGRFSFLIALFSTETGDPIATFDANAITRWRTAAVSMLAAHAGATSRPAAIAVFGTGVQGLAHVDAFSREFPAAEMRIIDRQATADERRAALDGASIVITATRSPTPLFEGAWVSPGAFVAAVGSSRPDTRELDDALLERSAHVIVEWREQTLREAGDLILAQADVRDRLEIVDLGEVLAGHAPGRTGEDEIVIFKSVGVGIEDIAVAALAYRLLA